jgi:hypothetical protein
MYLFIILFIIYLFINKNENDLNKYNTNYIKMNKAVENVNILSSFTRPLRIEDFCDNLDDKNKYNKNSYNNDTISKNQQEYGHKKRIKP